MSIPPFNPTCPYGGTYYICNTATSKFIGCCTSSDPCSTSSGCPPANLRPASFDASFYGKVADQSCQSGSYYTCTSSLPTFMGCCKSNPCVKGGCPVKDLAAAFLSKDALKAADFLGGLGDSGPATIASTVVSMTTLVHPVVASSTSTSSMRVESAMSSSTTDTTNTSGPPTTLPPTNPSSTSSSPTTLPANTPPPQSQHRRLRIEAIIGIELGLLVLLTLIAIFVYRRWRRKRQSKKHIEEMAQTSQIATPNHHTPRGPPSIAGSATREQERDTTTPQPQSRRPAPPPPPPPKSPRRSMPLPPLPPTGRTTPRSPLSPTAPHTPMTLRKSIIDTHTSFPYTHTHPFFRPDPFSPDPSENLSPTSSHFPTFPIIASTNPHRGTRNSDLSGKTRYSGVSASVYSVPSPRASFHEVETIVNDMDRERESRVRGSRHTWRDGMGDNGDSIVGSGVGGGEYVMYIPERESYLVVSPPRAKARDRVR